jgi:ABC-2 type transport system permease protein
MKDPGNLLIPTVSHNRLFLRLRGQLLRNTVHLLFHQASARVVSIVFCSLVVWVFVFFLSWNGFFWIGDKLKVAPFGNILGGLFDLLFLALGVMLVFSTGLILFSSLFTSPETTFLLSTPARADQVFAFKFQGALGFSSWAFLLLGSPVLLAYGLSYSVHWLFYLLFPLFFFGFILLPGSLGALICLLVVNFFPQKKIQALVALALLVLALLGVWAYRVAGSARTNVFDKERVNALLDQLILGRSPLNPTHWTTRGMQLAGQGFVLQTSRGEPGAFYYLTLVWSNGLVLYVGTTWLAGRLYRRGYNRLRTGSSLRRRYGGHWLDRILKGMVPFLDPQTRLLIVKDFRVFRRDPAQWAQILIFTGLMILYIANLRSMFLVRADEKIDWPYQNGLSLLNLATTGLLLCIFTGRFIFPMLSLEGRQFWILGLLPLRRDRLLWGKFAFSALGGLLIAEVLILASDLMLEVPWVALLLHLATVAVLAIGLSGLSVGLGACLPTFKETDPSKIAAGFGGTLNLVAGLIFLLLVILLMAMPWHVQAAWEGKPVVVASATGWLIFLPAFLGIGVGAGAAWFPLRAGAKALERMEF